MTLQNGHRGNIATSTFGRIPFCIKLRIRVSRRPPGKATFAAGLDGFYKKRSQLDVATDDHSVGVVIVDGRQLAGRTR